MLEIILPPFAHIIAPTWTASFILFVPLSFSVYGLCFSLVYSPFRVRVNPLSVWSLVFLGYLQLCFPEWGPCSNSISIRWELIRNANSLPPPPALLTLQFNKIPRQIPRQFLWIFILKDIVSKHSSPSSFVIGQLSSQIDPKPLKEVTLSSSSLCPQCHAHSLVVDGHVVTQ